MELITLTKSLSQQDSAFYHAEINHSIFKSDSTIHFVSFIKQSKKPPKHIDYSPMYFLLGRQFPDFKILNIELDTISLSYFYGKPTLLNFWFSDCPPCVAEIPILNGIAKEFENEVNFLAITFEPQKVVRSFLSENPFSFYHLINEFDLMKKIKLDGYPMNILIDENGKIIRIMGGIPFIETETGRKIGEAKLIRSELSKLTESQKN